VKAAAPLTQMGAQPLRVNKQRRKFHDPFGLKRPSIGGTVCQYQFMVGRSELNDKERWGPSVNNALWHCDKTSNFDRDTDKYVRTSGRNPEKMR
jgi:hypothetical protein